MTPTNDTVTVRMPRDAIPEAANQRWLNRSLWRKLSDSYHERHNDPIASAYANLASIALFWFTVISEYYVIINHIIPERYSQYDEMTRYYLKVFASFVTIQASANWLCVRYFDSVLRKPSERPLITTGSSHSESNHIWNRSGDDGQSTMYRKEDKVFMQTKYCEVCRLDRPYRTHHCIICKKCILKRDHHCYMTGTCVGYFNQRYFIVMNFYIAIGSLWGLYEISFYMLDTFVPDADWWDYCFPVTCFRWLVGWISLRHMLMMGHLYTLWWTGLASFTFIVWNFFLIRLGKTGHEVQNYVKVRSHATISEKLQSVFGAFWPVNFIFPAVLMFRQEGDGTEWIDLRADLGQQM